MLIDSVTSCLLSCCFLLITSVLCSCPPFLWLFPHSFSAKNTLDWLFLMIVLSSLLAYPLQLFDFCFLLVVDSRFTKYSFDSPVCHQATLYHYYENLPLVYVPFSPPSLRVIVAICYTITYIPITTSCYVYLNTHF